MTADAVPGGADARASRASASGTASSAGADRVSGGLPAVDRPSGVDDAWALPVRGLVLDIDDTLVDTQAAMKAAGVRAAAAALPELDPAAHEAISHTYYDDIGGHFDAYTRGELTFPEQRRRRLAATLVHLDIAAPDLDVSRYESAYLDAFAQVQRLFDDVATLFDAARDRGVAVCLLTNSGAEQTALKLRAVGLTDVAPVVTTDTLGVGKPDPRLFAAACAEIGVAAHEVVCVGDTLATDVRGALGAGMRVAWLQRPDRPEPRSAGWATPVDDPRVRIVGSLHDVAALL